MKTLTINIPGSADIDDKEAKMALASKLYERGKLTLARISHQEIFHSARRRGNSRANVLWYVEQAISTSTQQKGKFRSMLPPVSIILSLNMI